MIKNIKIEQGTVTNPEILEAMQTIAKYCAEHPHCVRCAIAIIGHCGATPTSRVGFFRVGGIAEWLRHRKEMYEKKLAEL